MSKKCPNCAIVDEKPKVTEVNEGDVLFVEYSEMALEGVHADTARMQNEIEGLLELNKKMAEEQKQCLQKADLPIPAYGEKLMPTLKKLEVQTDGMLRQFTKLIDAQIRLNESYSRHCKNAKEMLELQMKMARDGFVNKMVDKTVDETIEKLAKLMVDAVTERTSLSEDIAKTKKEMEGEHKSVLEMIATEKREQLMLVDALAKIYI